MAELAEGSRIEITSALDGDLAVQVVVGEIDLSTAESLRSALAPASPEPPPDRVALDLAGVTFMDSSGLSVLLEVASGGATVEIRSASDAVRRIIEVTGLTDTLRLLP